MRLSRLLMTLGAAATLPFLAHAAPPLLNSFGPLPNVAGDPPSFSNCSVCHVGAPSDSGPGSVSISGMPARYQPGSTYPVTITVADPNASRWGFEAGATDRSGNQAGSFAATSAGTSVQSQGAREWVNHNGGGTFQGVLLSSSWTFDWTAPPAGTGIVTLWVAGNAANNAQGNNGDLIYTAARSSVEDGAVQPLVTLAVQPDGVFPKRQRHADGHAGSPAASADRRDLSGEWLAGWPRPGDARAGRDLDGGLPARGTRGRAADHGGVRSADGGPGRRLVRHGLRDHHRAALIRAAAGA